MGFKNKNYNLIYNIALRGHHLACICNFINKGYDSKFISNMKKVKNYLDKNPNLNCIKLVSGFDDLCSRCPNRLNSCSSRACVERDLAFLKLFNLKIGDSVSFEQVLSKMKILTNETFANFCSGCRWFRLCNSIRKKTDKDRFNKLK